MRDRLTRQNAFAALLLAISILSLTPALVRADQQTPTYTVTITATGQGTAIGTGPSGATALNLTANAYENADNWLMLQNTTGVISIGSTSYPVTGGQGSVNQFGYIMIFADANSEKDNLILHGTKNGNSLSFTPPSELVAAAYLALSGTMTQGTDPTLSTVTSTSKNNTSISSTTNRTQETNSTVISTTVFGIARNVTGTSSEMISTSNSTQPAKAIGINATGTSTKTSDGGASAFIPQASGNVTVTVTQYLSRTSLTTQTVANMTLSYTKTMTATVANTTITQANATTTVTATTGT